MQTETSQIHRTIQELQAGWLAGSGAQFAAAFAPHARFVAFDGTLTSIRELSIVTFKVPRWMSTSKKLDGSPLEFA